MSRQIPSAAINPIPTWFPIPATTTDAVPTPFGPSLAEFDLFMRMIDRVREHSREYEERLLNYNRKHEQYCLDSHRQFNAASPQASDLQPPVFPTNSLPELIEELQHMAKSDPHVPFSSELFEYHASIPTKASDPDVSYTENVSAESDSVCLSMSPNKHSRPFMKVIPKTEKDVNVPVVEPTLVPCQDFVSPSKKSNTPVVEEVIDTTCAPRQEHTPFYLKIKQRRANKWLRVKRRNRASAKKCQRVVLAGQHERKTKSSVGQLPVLHPRQQVAVQGPLPQRNYFNAVMSSTDPIRSYLVQMDRNGRSYWRFYTFLRPHYRPTTTNQFHGIPGACSMCSYSVP